ncbi:MAG: energy transducer TonB [Bacteroidia bacterium]
MSPATRLSWTLFTIAALIVAGKMSIPTPEMHHAQVYSYLPEDVDLIPVLVNGDEINTLIGYPPDAWDAGIEGTVYLRIHVDAGGGYLSHEVVGYAHPLLQIPCEHFAPFLIFSPALKNGWAVPCEVIIPFEFKIP